MKWQEFVRDYLSFTRRERIGIIALVILIILVAFYPIMTPNNSKQDNVPNDTTWISTVKKLIIKDTSADQSEFQNTNQNDDVPSYQFDISKGSYGTIIKGDLFNFDPNTLNEAGWQKLGLRDKTINTIQNFLKKGGSFKKPEDLKKIYGLKSNEFERLARFIKIESYSNSQSEFKREKTDSGFSVSKYFKPNYSVIEINTADTTAFISLPGIGSKLAARIVNFRDKLGGFYSVDQVGETFGVPDSTFQKIKQYLMLENTLVRKININTATIDELKAHPYIRYILANPIVAYKNEHGPFLKVEDIKKVMLVTEEIFQKIFPYLSVQ